MFYGDTLPSPPNDDPSPMTPIEEFANALLRDPRRAADDIHHIKFISTSSPSRTVGRGCWIRKSIFPCAHARTALATPEGSIAPTRSCHSVQLRASDRFCGVDFAVSRLFD